MTGLGNRLLGLYRDTLDGAEGILNLGSGDGILSAHIRRLFPTAEVVDVDVMDRNRVGRPPLIYNGRDVPLPDGSFDVVIVAEDCADSRLDRGLCRIHGFLNSRHNSDGGSEFRTGVCWRRLFEESGLRVSRVVVLPRRLVPTYPVSRSVFFLEK